MGENKAELLVFLNGLRRESGACVDTFAGGEADLRATLSVVKAKQMLGDVQVEHPVIDFILRCSHDDGLFGATPQGDPTTFDTAVALITLKTLQQNDLLELNLSKSLQAMQDAAINQYDHFMLIEVYAECGITDPVPRASIEFFQKQLKESQEIDKVLDTSVACASLLRIGQSLDDPDHWANLILAGQIQAEGAFSNNQGDASLMSTYYALRALILLQRLPNVVDLLRYTESLRSIYGYSERQGSHTSATAIYQVLSIRESIARLQRIPVDFARQGNGAALHAWLENGGEPNLYDADGWTPLLAASSRGQATAVELLLEAGSDPELRYLAADALPVYLAGQAGDLDTVKLLLRARPEHLHAISAVNGHTVLLQAAFYGKEKHLQLAEYLLDNASLLGGKSGKDLSAEQAGLLCATNVRGYNALTMQDLWHNQKMKDLLLRYYPEDDEERRLSLERGKQRYYNELLLKIATPQALVEKLLSAIDDYLANDDSSGAERTIDQLLQQPQLDINRLGGALQQPALIFAITGVDVGNPARRERRYRLTKKLLEAGADPVVREKHPMAIGAVIRASVLNNFELLQLIADYMTPENFAREMNVSPTVNGLTAMHDAIHRALTSPPEELDGHIAQIEWMLAHGARLDIQDNTGQTQRQLVEAARDDPTFPEHNVLSVRRAIDSEIHEPMEISSLSLE